VPAGDAAKGFVAGAFNPAGTDFAVIQDIQKLVYAKGQGDMQDPKRVGSTYYNRGVGHGIIYVEALRLAQEKFGKGKPVTGEQMRWALENLKLDEKRLEAIGAKGLMPALALSCADHEGSGRVRFQQWDGTKWVSVSDWIEPDRELVRSLVEESAAAAESMQHQAHKLGDKWSACSSSIAAESPGQKYRRCGCCAAPGDYSTNLTIHAQTAHDKDYQVVHGW